MNSEALDGINVVDVSGTVGTGYCSKVFADYGAQVVNLETESGFATRRLGPHIPGVSEPENSAMHAFLSTNKKSVVATDLSSDVAKRVLQEADLILDDGSDWDGCNQSTDAIRSSITWYGKGGPYSDFVGSDMEIFALNGMLRGIGHIDGPPIIPTGYQAQIIGGASAFIGSMAQVFGKELGNSLNPVDVETSIYESCLCFTDVGIVGAYSSGIVAPRMGINRFPPTYPLGVFPCKDGWIGVTVLTPSQWHAFCKLLEMDDLSQLELFQSAIGRLQGIDIIEPRMREKLLTFSAEDIFYRSQKARVPLARVPTMEELFDVDQFVERNAFSLAHSQHYEINVPSVPFRLFRTPPKFGGVVAHLGAHTKDYA